MKHFRPLIREARLAWIGFQLKTLNPLAPQLPELLHQQAQLMDERSKS
jgi:hypothetical protein